MLAGRESLARLVGKRRRNLPRDALLRRISHSHSVVADAKDRAAVPKDAEKELAASDGSVAGGGVGKEWVECPVCGKSIRGDDYMVNSHLDSCLTRGKKRKLTQRTLLQLNFCTKTSQKNLAHESVIQQENAVELQRDGVGDYEMLNGMMGGCCQRSDDLLEPDLNLSHVDETGNKVLTENKDRDDCIVMQPMISSMLISDDSMDETNHFNLVETLSTAVLETVVVGHKFQNEANLFQGASVCVLRDCGNVKDQHALKVVCSDSGGDVMVGYLRSELAKYLSPLVDKFRIRLEGSVTSNFDASGVIPVRLICQEIQEHKELEASEVLHWKKAWEDVLRVVEDEKMHPPSMMKYQRNFHIMLQEVLNHHAHLLEDHEKTFLWNFNSLSDDSQRTFIRLYMRKGPWFRVSSISYAEVGNTPRAIEELQLAGYTCPFIVDAGPVKSDIAEILDVLTVSELKEISSMVIFKKCANGTRKDQLVGHLLTAHEEGKCPLLPNFILEHAGACVKISPAAESIMWRIQRLFFLNGEQDLSSFLLVDLGVVKYPTYMCTISRPIFRHRDELLAYEEAIAVAQLMDESIDDNNIELAMRCTHFSDEQLSNVLETLSLYSQFSASWVYSKVVTLGVSICERDRSMLMKLRWSGPYDCFWLEKSMNLLMVTQVDPVGGCNWFRSWLHKFSDKNDELNRSICDFKNGRFPLVIFRVECNHPPQLHLYPVFIARYEDAVLLLKRLLKKITCGGKRGYWYLRLSVDLEHMGRINESLSAAEEGLLDPWIRAGSRIALQRRVLRLGKPPRRWKVPSFAASISKKIKEVHIQGRPLNCETGAKNYYYGYDGMHCNVEELALQYYKEEGGGWKGVHTESGVWLTIFGLLTWDVIFSNVPDVFQTRFQTAPLDLEMDSFYQSRRDLIESHVQKIEAGMAEEILISSWECHFGTACRGVNWDRHCLPDLRAAVSCIGGRCLASLLRHLAQDYGSWSSGMPDLFLWRFRGGDLDGGEAKLVEVKGPRDRLSEQQRAWMLFLMDCGFDTEVCRVSMAPPKA